MIRNPGLRAVLLTAPLLTTVAPLAPSVAGQPLTLKERLSDKASDEQRVDNCKVPPDRRGPKPRPDCPVAHAPPNYAPGRS